MQSISISDALFTKTQQRVLGLLYGKPDKSFYTNEIIRWADMGRGTIRRELDCLVNAGLLTVTREGNQNHYRANQDNPIYNELLAITRKTFGMVDVIREALKSLDSHIQLAFIYGSIAKSADTKQSDIDLMLVADGLHYADVMEKLLPLEESLQRKINPTIYNGADFASKLELNNSFLVRVMEQPKLIIEGAIDDFRQPATD
ncbi:nucleotidyltransferase domain-containing protein [Pseudomonadota bacterium]